jgi:putative SOS response-associated peptidase YedK
MPIILDWRNVGEWIAGDEPATLLRTPPDDALQEWIVSPRMNKAGVGDDDATLLEPMEIR